MNSWIGDESGSSFLEFALVFPLTILVILGTVDVSLLMFDWGSATAATYAGARVAALSDPVASDVDFDLSSYTSQATYSGRYCFDAANGNADSKAACPSVSIQCTGTNTAAVATCSSGGVNKAVDKAAFTAIFNAVQAAYPARKLDPRQVRVSYVTTNLGFVGQQNFNGDAGELPMNVSVELRCIAHEFYFVGPLLGWTFGSLPSSCSGITTGTQPGIVMPPFYTTLPSEDLTTN